MGRKKNDPTSKTSRNFKLLLYPDNPAHNEALAIIKADYPEHIGILHNANPDRKQHYHIALSFEVPKMLKTVARDLGLVSDLGEPDCQFVRVCDGRLSRFLVYLTHLDQPDKEQYQASELFGSSYFLAEYGKAATKFLRNEFDMADCVLACLDWLRMQDGIVSMWSFARWICNTPYFKASSSPLVRSCIEEHNQKIYNAMRKKYVDQITEGSEKMQAILNYPEALPVPDDMTLEGWEEI